MLKSSRMSLGPAGGVNLCVSYSALGRLCEFE